MIILLDTTNPAGGNRALVLIPSDTSSGFELYKVLYSPEKGEKIEEVGEDHVTFLCQGWGFSLIHAAVDELMHWADRDNLRDFPAFAQRMDEWAKIMEAGLPASSRGT